MRVASIATTPNPNNCLGAAPAIFFFSSSVFLSLGCGRERKKEKKKKAGAEIVLCVACALACACAWAWKLERLKGCQLKEGETKEDKNVSTLYCGAYVSLNPCDLISFCLPFRSAFKFHSHFPTILLWRHPLLPSPPFSFFWFFSALHYMPPCLYRK